MLKRHSLLFISLAAFAVGGGLPLPRARAAQTPAAPQAAKAATEEGPVALTERSKPPEKKEEDRPIPVNHFGLISGIQLNNRGDIAIISRYPTEKGEGSGVFIRKADGSWATLLKGEKPVNLPHPLLNLQGTHLADNGDLAFAALVDGPPPAAAFHGEDVAQLKSLGVFTKTAEGIKLYAQSGEEVPGMPSKFYGFSNVSRNAKGTIAFIGTYADPDGRALFVIEDGKLKLVARSGQKSPALQGALFSEHFFPSAINERGELAFFCHIGSSAAIFLKRADHKIEPIVVQGEPSPIAGANFSGFANRAPVINSKGDVAFSAFVDGPNAARVLFFKPQGQPVRVLLKSGDLVPDTAAKFSDFYMPSVNANGEVAFVGTFGGRTRGVFLKTAEGVEKIALGDDAIPGQTRGKGEPTVFNNFLFPQVNDRGDVVFITQLRPSSVAVFVKRRNGPLEKVVQIGDKTPLVK
jgi:hypothetical protein